MRVRAEKGLRGFPVEKSIPGKEYSRTFFPAGEKVPGKKSNRGKRYPGRGTQVHVQVEGIFIFIILQETFCRYLLLKMFLAQRFIYSVIFVCF